MLRETRRVLPCVYEVSRGLPAGQGMVLTFKVGHERLGDALDLVEAAHEYSTGAVGVHWRARAGESCSGMDEHRWGRELSGHVLVASSCEGWLRPDECRDMDTQSTWSLPLWSVWEEKDRQSLGKYSIRSKSSQIY